MRYLKSGETLLCLAAVKQLYTQKSYSERRKFRTSCCWLVLRLSKLFSTVVASLPLLSWASIAARRLVQRPSCRKNTRCPSPHRGAVRNWSPPALPCEMLSASTVPMWWNSRSVNEFTGALARSAVALDACVLPCEGLWQVAQPMELNSERPLAIEVELTDFPFSITPPCCGGASRRMKLAKAETSSSTAAAFVVELPGCGLLLSSG